MKKYIKKLFESTDANFGLSVHTWFTSENKQGKEIDNVYLADNGSLYAKPSTFLVFEYFAVDPNTGKRDYNVSKSLFTSTPHIRKIRKYLLSLEAAIDSGDAFEEVINKNADGQIINKSIFVKPKYAEALTVHNIGSKNGYISFQLRTDVMQDNNDNFFPCVTVSIPNTPRASVLSITEFLTVLQHILDVNLATLSDIHTVAYLNSQKNTMDETANEPAKTYQNNYTRNAPSNTGYKQNNNNGYQQNNGYNNQNYNQNKYGQNQQSVTNQPDYGTTTNGSQQGYWANKNQNNTQYKPTPSFSDEVVEYSEVDDSMINGLFEGKE